MWLYCLSVLLCLSFVAILFDRTAVLLQILLGNSLEKALAAVDRVPYSYSFEAPVDTRVYRDYRDRVQYPIALSDIRARVKTSAYSSRGEFLSDIKLLRDNCVAVSIPFLFYSVFVEVIYSRTGPFGCCRCCRGGFPFRRPSYLTAPVLVVCGIVVQRPHPRAHALGE